MIGLEKRFKGIRRLVIIMNKQENNRQKWEEKQLSPVG